MCDECKKSESESESESASASASASLIAISKTIHVVVVVSPFQFVERILQRERERERVDFSNFCCSSLSVRVVTPAAPSQSRAKRRIVPQPETQVSSISIQRCFRFSDLVFSEFRSFRSVDSVSLVAIRSCVVD